MYLNAAVAERLRPLLSIVFAKASGLRFGNPWRGSQMLHACSWNLRGEEHVSGAHPEGESQMKTRLEGLIAGAFLLSGAPAFAATLPHEKPLVLPPSVSSGDCQTNAAKYSVSTDLQKSSSKSYRDVTGTAIAFNQGADGCAEVAFSAEAATNPGQILVTRVVLDGSNVCLPGDNLFASDSPSGDLADHAMNYICPNVPAGSHTAKVQFRSRFGGAVALDYRTTIVRYGK